MKALLHEGGCNGVFRNFMRPSLGAVATATNRSTHNSTTKINFNTNNYLYGVFMKNTEGWN